MAAGRDIQVRLFRDALSTPWGFRLTGGKDVHAPLIIQRVAIGSPVEGELHRGDVILEIQSQNATNMTHRQAQDAIRNSGGSISLRVRRPHGQQQADSTLIIPKAHDYLPTHRGFILGRLQETLNNVVGYQPMTSSGYGSSSLSDYGDYNSPMSPPPSTMLDNGHYPTWTRAPPKQRPPTITPLSDPGWTPQCLLNKPHGRRPQTATSSLHERLAQHIGRGQSPSYGGYGVVEEPETPAWVGSLRPSVESKKLDERAAGLQASGHDGHQQFHPTSRGGGPSVIVLPEGAQHLQYNSPLGLYNNTNVQQVVAGHFGGVSNATTNGTSAANDSDVYRMVHENDRRSQPSKTSSAARGSTRLTLPQTASSDSIRQSPSIHLLESRLAHGQDSGDASVGITDF